MWQHAKESSRPFQSGVYFKSNYAQPLAQSYREISQLIMSKMKSDCNVDKHYHLFLHNSQGFFDQSLSLQLSKDFLIVISMLGFITHL